MKKLLLTLLLTSQAFAGIGQAPPSFTHNQKKAVWVDFTEAEYKIVYNAKKGTAIVNTTIKFDQAQEGYPLFDAKTTITDIRVDGVKSSQSLISSPGNITKVRLVGTKLAAGSHVMTLTSSISTGVKFNLRKDDWGNVSSAFFIRDLRDRMLLERYLPTNLEYDNYKMTIDAEVTETKRHHNVFANGAITQLTNNHYRIVFPDYYVSSSVYFHIVPVNKFVRWYLKYKSIDGRDIPVAIYSNNKANNKLAKDKAWKVMQELEADYGPWPHEQLVIYITGLSGGMEYAGATETSLRALGHELQHGYFAKGIHPANGNAGWMDEAIASWRDRGHQTIEIPFYKNANLGNQSAYTRKTDTRSYKYGRSFMAYMDFKLKAAGKKGLKDFLNLYAETRMHTSVTTEDFKSDIEKYSGLNLDADFKQFIYTEGSSKLKKKSREHQNPFHPEITEEQLHSIL